jgi:DNA-directed RNA polymerase subunit RPC12/RpoP
MPEQEPNTNVSCSRCGASVPEPGRIDDQTPCPSCGSTARTFAVTLTDKAEAHDSLGTKARHGDIGKVKPHRETFTGFDYHQDSAEWRQVSRVVDREADRYTERIVDAAGNVVRDVDEPLSEHRGHGTAKRRRSRPGSGGL